MWGLSSLYPCICPRTWGLFSWVYVKGMSSLILLCWYVSGNEVSDLFIFLREWGMSHNVSFQICGDMTDLGCRSLFCLLMYIPRCEFSDLLGNIFPRKWGLWYVYCCILVCDSIFIAVYQSLFVGVFHRVLGLWFVSGYVSQSKKSLVCLCM